MLVSKENGVLIKSANSSQSARVEYVTSFDGLRGFAVLLVLLCHASYGLFPGGFLGVDLFFIVSGYLITSLLWVEYTASSNISLKNFYIRRILRLYPALLLGIVLALLLWQFSPPGGNRFIASFASLFYMANIIDEKIMGNMNPFWSLAVEEHFYLIWPLFLLLVATKLNGSYRISLIVAVIAGITIFRIIAGFHQGEWRHGIFFIDAYGFTLCRIDGIMIGALLYFLIQQKKLSLSSRHHMTDIVVFSISAAFIVICGFVLSWSNPWWLRGGFLITNAAAALVVFEALRKCASALFTNKLMMWIGRRSYGIYLYHLPIFLALEPLRVHHDNLNFLLISLLRILLAIIAAEVSYQFVEKPVLRYKRRFQVYV